MLLSISWGDVYYPAKNQEENHTAGGNRHRFTGVKSA